MSQIDFITAILFAAGTLVLGFAAAFLIENGRISTFKKENAILKATSYTEKATARARNLMIGGHNGY